jgi:hypothetical protein
MCNTRGAAAVATLRQRVCLLAPSVTVCVVVCVRRMTCVPHAGYSAELWRFSTSTRVWERADSIAVNGPGPGPRWGHVMTSVGLDLWAHGGYTGSGEGDACDCCCCHSVARSCSDCVFWGVCTAHDLYGMVQGFLFRMSCFL